MANEMRDRLKENISIIKQHNERGLPVKHITKGEKYEVEVIAEIVEDVSLIIEKMEKETLIELPCKVGETLWLIQIDYMGEYSLLSCLVSSKITMFSILRAYEESTVLYMSTDKAEAEQKLKEMRVDNG